MKKFKIYSGIDTLYYYCETNDAYDNLFLDILDQIESIKNLFEEKQIAYKFNDINIKIKDIDFQHLGRSEGFYWFRDVNQFFKIGFKDKCKNTNMKDIRVQLQADGIYTLGLSTLLKYINEEVLSNYTTGYYPITRVDLNTFLAYDFSFVNKEMFVSRKRHYSQITEMGSAKRTQTIYVGKPPFRLRLYDKKLEMQQSKKKELMHEFFLNEGFNLNEELFNIEYEMHREHLKAYDIDTVEDALFNAQSLFRNAMDEIRLIDLNSITEKDIKNNSKNRAITLPIWDEIKNNYCIENFMQNVFPVERIKRNYLSPDMDQFIEEYIQLIRKFYIYGIVLNTESIENLYQKAIASLLPPRPKEQNKQRYIEIIIENIEGKKEEYRLLESGEVFNASKMRIPQYMDNDELVSYLDELSQNDMETPLDKKRYEIVYTEAFIRDLVPEIPF